MSKWIVCIGGILLSWSTWAQQSDSLKTVLLQDVLIFEDMLKSSEIGLSEVKIDSMTLTQTAGTNISDLLRNNAAGQIRSYGTNGLTSPSFRGTGAAHTAILWNGINLQSSLNGSSDLSLLPVGFVDEINLQKGGTSALYGSGAIGGTIQLNNQARFNKGLSLSTQQKAGSFGNYFQSYGVSFSSGKFNTSTLLFHRKLKNDYPYENQYVRPTAAETRQNAAINQKGILQQNDWQINQRHLVGIKLWLQDNRFEIPVSIIASDENEATQNDQFIRGMLNWNYDHEKLSVVYKQAVIWHKLLYDPSSGNPSDNSSLAWVNRLETNVELNKNHSIISGINHNFDRASVDNFANDPQRNSTAIFTSINSKWLNKQLLTAISFRQELVDGKLAPFVPSLGVEYNLFEQLILKGNVSKNYRVPTFNDLYWIGNGAMGNSELKAESSFNYEAGFKYDFFKKTSPFKLGAGGTYYNYLVDDWIQWNEENDIWSPKNLKKVKSWGIETLLTSKYQLAPIYLSFDLIYNYTKTINKEVAQGVNENQLNKQLAYTPLHEASLNLQFGYHDWRLRLNHVYTGKQYTEGENRNRFALDAYQIMNLTMNKTFEWNKINLSLQGEVNNLLNVNYENRRGYPMYGRNYSIGLAIKFINKT